MNWCYACGRTFTHHRQYAWTEQPLVRRGGAQYRVRVCRGIVQCGKRRIDLLGCDSIPASMRRWLGIDGYVPAVS